jgi:hypothetical protein
MANSLDNLAMAAVQKNETLEKLIEMNAQKDKIIANLAASLASEKATSTKLLDIISKTGLKMGNTTGGGSGTTSRWEPHGYCWSHGYRVTRNHTSATCKTPKEGHQAGATRAITLGGCDDNKQFWP